MDVETIKKLIAGYENSAERHRLMKMCREGESYYHNNNDIRRRPAKLRDDHPLRTADNRIGHNWHGLLVRQKAGYLFGKDPTIDVRNPEMNKSIKKCLGDEWPKTLGNLTTVAANKGVGWLHLWKEDGQLQYGIVPTEEIYPIYTQDLKRRLKAVIRRYLVENEAGVRFVKVEYWDEKACTVFRGYGSALQPCCLTEAAEKQTNVFSHPFGRVPFVYFYNNSEQLSDLHMYKDLVDQFDTVVSGFADDLQDVQEIVFVLEGYGGEDLEEFMSDLKDFKAVKTDDGGDVRTIKAEIPVEARDKFLDDLKQSIFLFGMGVNPDRDSLGDSSGVALKFLYSLLELKASATRMEFDCSIKVLVRMILDYLGVSTYPDIDITYHKNMITNDKEVTEILAKSGEILSDKTKTKNHPYVENLDAELQQLKAEAQETDPEYAGYGQAVTRTIATEDKPDE